MTNWQPIATAPKSTTRETPYGNDVTGIYFLAYCPDMVGPHSNPQAGICVCWWEPHMDGNGRWQGEADYPLHPTHWMPLPDAPADGERRGKP